MQPARPSFLEYFEQKEKENVQNDGLNRQNDADNRRPEGDLQVVSSADHLQGLLVFPSSSSELTGVLMSTVPAWTASINLHPDGGLQPITRSAVIQLQPGRIYTNQISSVVDLQENAKRMSPWQRRPDGSMSAFAADGTLWAARGASRAASPL